MPFSFSGLMPPKLGAALADRVPVRVSLDGLPVELRPTETGASGSLASLQVRVDIVRGPTGCASWTTCLTNTGADTIRDVAIMPIDLEFTLPHVLPRVRHLSGSWHYDGAYPPRAFRLHEEAFLTHDHARRIAIGGVNGGVHSPLLQVGIGSPLEEGFFVGLEWSAGWRLDAGWSEPSFNGESRTSFSVTGNADLGLLVLEPGEVISVPTVHLGSGAVGDWAQLDTLQRAYLRDLMPATGLPALPVSYDSWFGRYERFGIDTLMADAERAADLGVEVFCVDACWYRSADVTEGLGNWFTPDPDRFPNGEADIIALSEYVRGRGMRFGLWHLIQLAEIGSDVALARPDLFRRQAQESSRDRNEREFGNLARADAPSFDGLVLALERPEAVDYALEILERWISEWGVEWFRFESVPEDGLAYNEGYNRLLDELRTRHPSLYIEVCNGGGQRLDINSIRRTHGNWLSDQTSAPEIARFQQTGAARFWPARMLNMAVTAFAGTGDRNSSMYEVISRMAGVLSFNGAISQWSPEATHGVRGAVDVYKSIRHLIDQDAIFPLRQPLTVDDWDAVIFADPERRDAVLMVFRFAGADTVRLDLPWHASADLLLSSDDDADITETPGGFDLRLADQSAAIWRLRPRSED